MKRVVVSVRASQSESRLAGSGPAPCPVPCTPSAAGGLRPRRPFSRGRGRGTACSIQRPPSSALVSTSLPSNRLPSTMAGPKKTSSKSAKVHPPSRARSQTVLPLQEAGRPLPISAGRADTRARSPDASLCSRAEPLIPTLFSVRRSRRPSSRLGRPSCARSRATRSGPARRVPTLLTGQAGVRELARARWARRGSPSCRELVPARLFARIRAHRACPEACRFRLATRLTSCSSFLRWMVCPSARSST